MEISAGICQKFGKKGRFPGGAKAKKKMGNFWKFHGRGHDGKINFQITWKKLISLKWGLQNHIENKEI